MQRSVLHSSISQGTQVYWPGLGLWLAGHSTWQHKQDSEYCARPKPQLLHILSVDLRHHQQYMTLPSQAPMDAGEKPQIFIRSVLPSKGICFLLWSASYVYHFPCLVTMSGLLYLCHGYFLIGWLHLLIFFLVFYQWTILSDPIFCLRCKSFWESNNFY